MKRPLLLMLFLVTAMACRDSSITETNPDPPFLDLVSDPSTTLAHVTLEADHLWIDRTPEDAPSWGVWAEFSCSSGQIFSVTGSATPDGDQTGAGSLYGKLLVSPVPTLDPPYDDLLGMETHIEFPPATEWVGWIQNKSRWSTRSCTIENDIMHIIVEGPGAWVVNNGSTSLAGPAYLSASIYITSYLELAGFDIKWRLLGLEDPAELTLDPPDGTGVAGASHTVIATVRDGDIVPNPLPGETVAFHVTGASSVTGQCTTDAAGVCSFIYQGPQQAGVDQILAFVDSNGDGVRNLGEVSGVAAFGWEVTNNPPTADAGGPYSGSEGGPIDLDGSGSTDPDGDPLTFEWELNNDGQFDDAAGPSPSLTFPDGPDSYSACLRVTDSSGEAAVDCTTVDVSNVAPEAIFDQSGPVDEGQAFTLTLSEATDPSPIDAAGLEYAFDCGDGSGLGSFGSTTAAGCATDDNGELSVKGVVRDKDGGQTEYVATVTVHNVPPSLGPLDGPADPIQVGTLVTVTGTFTDPGVQDTHTAAYDWGDGNGDLGTVTEANGSGSVSGAHTYVTPGVHRVSVTVTDDDGGSDTQVFEFGVAYDPSVGFVTGGGWIESPAGAYVADPLLTGKASFGFVAKYKKGAQTLAGNTEFLFRAADLNFHSSSYQWLVVTQGGANAQFKGSGTINGAGDYRFMVWAGDGSPDTFRIRVWTEDALGNEIDVYDNGADQIIGGGSIVIHAK